jgi:acyl-CoA thioesterase-1
VPTVESMFGRPVRIIGLIGALSVSAVLVGAVAHGATRPRTTEGPSAGSSTSAPASSAAASKSATATPKATSTATPTPTSTPTPTKTAAAKPVAVAIGDSIMDGHGMTEAQSYPALLADSEGWTLDNLSSDGTGYVTLGVDDNTFQAQADAAVALNPAIVLIAGSSNDLGQDNAALNTAETQLISTIATKLPNAQIIALNTFWGDTAVPAQLLTIDSQVQTAVAAVGGDYIDIGQPLAGRPDLMQSDDVHPTPQGQQLLASAVAAKLPTDITELATNS